MCGIVAYVGECWTASRAEVSLAALRHRGPDMEGDWRDEAAGIWLGHRRLSIVDVSEAGRQPMLSEDGRTALVCNGEIYNAPALRRELEQLGHRFVSSSDSEVVLHGYEQWGEACLDRLEGMFAFAIWDGRKRRLFAARDRVGIKPLYVAEIGDGLVLASEVRGLWPWFGEKPRLDADALAEVMARGYVPSPRSMWRGVIKLEPSGFLVWERGKPLRHGRYWQPPESLDNATGHEPWVALWERVLSDHLLSDVPLGLFLSGGMDSSSVATGLVEAGHHLNAMSLAFPGSPRDESPVARLVAEHLGLPLKVWVMDDERLSSSLEQELAVVDEPQGYSAVLSMRALCKQAAARYKVAFSGDGGDEVHGGYGWYQSLEPLPPKRLTARRRWLRAAMRCTTNKRVWHAAGAALSQLSPLHRHAWRLFPRFLPEEIERLLRPTGVRFSEDRLIAPLREYDRAGLPLRKRLQRIDLMTFCSDSILAKVDRASMAYGLEVRVPMLDRRVIEWGMSQPMAAELGDILKPMVRSYLKSRLPKKVLAHEKQGFSVPLIKTLDPEMMIRRIHCGKLVSDGWLTEDWDKSVGSGTASRHARLFVLFSLSVWFDRWSTAMAP